MRWPATLSQIVISLLANVTCLKRFLKQRLEPTYQEKYSFRIQSQSTFEKEELQNILQSEIQNKEDIEANVVDYFSEKDLGPKELHDRHFVNSSSTVAHRHYNVQATVEIILTSDWESGDRALKQLRDRLEQFGTVSKGKTGADVYDHFID